MDREPLIKKDKPEDGLEEVIREIVNVYGGKSLFEVIFKRIKRAKLIFNSKQR